jgi:hypothetical protein
MLKRHQRKKYLNDHPLAERSIMLAVLFCFNSGASVGMPLAAEEEG